MPNDTPDLNGPILRIFEVRTKPGSAETLLKNFATTSAAVVKDEPGNLGYYFGRMVQGPNEGDGDGHSVTFVSVWKNLAAVKQRFGGDWQVSFMPDGYEDLIETCSVRHIDASDGWCVGGS